jgi:hypothetical protein
VLPGHFSVADWYLRWLMLTRDLNSSDTMCLCEDAVIAVAYVVCVQQYLYELMIYTDYRQDSGANDWVD